MTKEPTALTNTKNSPKPYGFGNTNRRFPHANRQKSEIAKDRFAFDQAMQGHDCQKVGRGGDFVVQKRDFFGGVDGDKTVVDVKSGGSRVTEEQLRRRKTLRGRYKIVRF